MKGRYMENLDPGHVYQLNDIDGSGHQFLTFVKREGAGYPGNVGHYPGTIIQDVLRCCIDRLKYVDNQISDIRNDLAIKHLRTAIYNLESRAAERHGIKFTLSTSTDIELL